VSGTRDSALLWAAGMSFVVAIIAGQALTDAQTPTGIVTGTGASVGRAAFSYMAGVRAFAAYQLWNRMDPIGHEYYDGMPLDQAFYVIPTMRIVTLLKPDFVPPYYVLPWVLARNGKLAEAKALALQGIADNPRSGLLLMSYAQILAVEIGDWAGAVPYADRAMRSDTYWADDTEKFQGYRIAEDVYIHVGDTPGAKAAGAVLDALAATGESSPDPSGSSHDHNGDGVADH
jgi:hypothetical protein